MAMIRSFTVGAGDMFYIRHNSDNFTIIDCQLFGDHKEWLVEELKRELKDRGVIRFISTHPDEDHIEGIEYLDEQMPIANFYVVRNSATKPDETESFKHYCQLRDSEKAFYVHKGCERKWMNFSRMRFAKRLAFKYSGLIPRTNTLRPRSRTRKMGWPLIISRLSPATP